MVEPTPIEMLKSDHQKVENLFADFHSAGEIEEKKDIAQKIFRNLKVHMRLEEELFYPKIAEAGGEGEKLIERSTEEHQAIKNLIGSLEKSEPGNLTFIEYFDTLVSTTRDHIIDEEEKVFPYAEMNLGDELGVGMGAKMMAYKGKDELEEIL